MTREEQNRILAEVWAVRCVPFDTLWDMTFPTEQCADEAIVRILKSHGRTNITLNGNDFEIIRVEIREVKRKKGKK